MAMTNTTKNKTDDSEDDSPEEAHERFENEGGALNTPPKHLKDIPKKRPESHKNGAKDIS